MTTPGPMGGEAVAPDPGMVDPERVIKAADAMAALAANIPESPPRLNVPGNDPLSMAIKNGAARFEERIQTGLPALKAAMLRTAAEIGAAGRAQRDQRRDAPALGGASPACATLGATAGFDADRESGEG